MIGQVITCSPLHASRILSADRMSLPPSSLYHPFFTPTIITFHCLRRESRTKQQKKSELSREQSLSLTQTQGQERRVYRKTSLRKKRCYTRSVFTEAVSLPLVREKNFPSEARATNTSSRRREVEEGS